MQSISSKLYDFICQEAKKNFPNESCGLILKKGKKQRIVAVPNVSLQPNNQFLMARSDVEAAANGEEILCVWHTHCNIPPKPSEADVAGCEATSVPWVIVSVYKDEDGPYSFSDMFTLEPSGELIDYIGRPYVFGSLDCWTLIRDYYKREYGVSLGEYPRIHEFWKSPTSNFFGDKSNWESEGLYSIQESELKEGDLIFFSTDGSGNPNHAAVYIGGDLILHHVTDRLSKRDVYYGYWEKNAVAFLRCKHVS